MKRTTSLYSKLTDKQNQYVSKIFFDNLPVTLTSNQYISETCIIVTAALLACKQSAQETLSVYDFTKNL